MSDAQLFIDTLRIESASDPRDLAARWMAANASALVRLAEHEGAALWLHRRLAQLGIVLDAPAREQLSAVVKADAVQCLRVDAGAVRAVGLLDAAGIDVIPLKGAAVRMISGRVPYGNVRAPTDIDVLCRASEAQAAWELLIASGYTAYHEAPSHHLPALFGPGGVTVEIHLTTVADVAPAEAWRRATCDATMVRFGQHLRPVPGDTELLWHAMSHTLVGTDRARNAFRLRHWADGAALLASEAGSTIDWERIRARIDSQECERPDLARRWLETASMLAGRALPDDALSAERAKPFNLERLLAWRLKVLERYPRPGRWRDKLLEEGARGETALPVRSAPRQDSAYARTRHWLAAASARAVWAVSS